VAVRSRVNEEAMPDQPFRPPSVERLLAAVRPRIGERDHDAILAVARAVVEDERGRLAAGEPARTIETLADTVEAQLIAFESAAGPPPVINATGVVIHTNLGRAPWPAAAIEAARLAARDPLLLELDPERGRRGRRYRAAEEHLIALTGADDALIVNNAAAALALAVGLAGRRGVAVARGELVEIGGGVRIPEVVRRAGARLVEVGTTNRTRVGDFAEALEGGGIGLVLRVHPSNFVQSGFVESPDPAELAELAHRHEVPLVDDLGSGALLDTARLGLAHEPTPSERLGDGEDLVVFSGDKLVGGPQAGLVVGRADLVARMRRDPLARAMRPDKTTLAGVAATLGLYRAGVALREIPVWRMLTADPASLRTRTETMAVALATAAASTGERAAGGSGGIGAVRPVELRSTVGGGSLPGASMPSFGLAVAGRSADRLLAALRSGEPPVIGRIESGEVLLDLRTVPPEQDQALLRAVRRALAQGGRRA
jgi:L-seryl-tRNA(Ser) seleniumtransferase